MASMFLKALLLITSMVLSVNSQVMDHQISYQLMTEELKWPRMMSMYDESGADEVEECGDDDDIASARRSLYRKHMRHYHYISYGALSANRIPCPPRSGRSYYTHDCFKARKSVNPYTRGCSRITRCRR